MHTFTPVPVTLELLCGSTESSFAWFVFTSQENSFVDVSKSTTQSIGPVMFSMPVWIQTVIAGRCDNVVKASKSSDV